MTSRMVVQGFPILAKSLSAGTPSLIPRLSCWWCLMPPRMSGEPTSEGHSQTHLRWVDRSVTGRSCCFTASVCLPIIPVHAQPPCLPAGS